MILGKYNQTKTVYFDLFKIDGIDFEPAAAFAIGDVKIMKNEGVEANTTNLPVDEGQGYSLVLTATEMSAARIKIYVVDQTATKVWLDTTVYVESYGNALAEHAFDLDTASTAQTADHTSAIAAIPTVMRGTDNALLAASINLTAGAVDTVSTVSNQVSSNITAIGGDATSATNVKNTYNGVGYTDDVAPATQLQIGKLSVSSASIATAASSYVLTTGTQSLNTVGDTDTVNNTRHEHTDTAGALELYYEFSVGGSGVATDIVVTGRINGSNDDLNGIYAWNWSGSSWDRLGDYNGKNSNTDDIRTYSLLARHTGSGVNLGKARIRFFAASGLSSATLRIDQIYVGYAVISQSVGYADGAIWVNTVGSNTNTEAFVDGVADNPISTWAAALTLSVTLGITRFRFVNGSSITLTGNSDSYTLIGTSWTLALGGQSIASALISGASVSGIGVAASRPNFINCILNTCSLPAFHAVDSALVSTITFTAAGDYLLSNCHSGIAGSATPILDTGALVANVNLAIPDYHQGIEIQNLNANGVDNFSLSGVGQVVYAATSSGAVNQRGDWKVTNTGGVVITTDDNTSGIASIKQVTDLGTRGNAITGTLSTTQMTTDLTEVTNNHFNGKLITWTSGVLSGQQSDITAYDGTAKKLTYTTTTDVPSNGDGFILT